MISLYLSLSALSCLSFASTEHFLVPLVRKRAHLPIIYYASAADASRNKYGHIKPPTSKRRCLPNTNHVCPPLVNKIPRHSDEMYLGVVQIGTPCVLYFDDSISGAPTSNLKTALHRSTSQSTQAPRTCGSPAKLIPLAAGARVPQGSIPPLLVPRPGQAVAVTLPYYDSTFTGNLVRDTVDMGGSKVLGKHWVLVNQAPFDDAAGPNAGVVGLGFKTRAGTGGTSFRYILVRGRQWAVPEMTFWITRLLGDPDAQAGEFGGIFILGGRNRLLYKDDVEFPPLVANVEQGPIWLLNNSDTYLIHPCLALGYFLTHIS